MKKLFILIFVFTVGFAAELDDSAKLNALSEYFVSEAITLEASKLAKPEAIESLKQSEFETAEDFTQRTNRTKQAWITYNTAINDLKAKYQSTALSKALGVLYGKPIIENLTYNASTEQFFAKLRFSKNTDFAQSIAIAVPKAEAKAFKEGLATMTPEGIFNLETGKMLFSHVEFGFNAKKYKGELTDGMFKANQIAMVLKNDLISGGKSDTMIASSGQFNDDLELLLSSITQVPEDKTKWLFVVGVEKYEFTDNINYSTRSAKMFIDVAKKALGVGDTRVYSLINEEATLSKIKTNLKRMLRNVNAGDTIYFYYNGHGVPVPSLDNEPFMLASDVDLDFIQDDKFFSLQNIYTELSQSNAARVVAIVDSCFSGATDGKAIVKGVAATRVKAKAVEFDKTKMAVITAGKDKQFSNGYDKRGHRMFSYFVMKNILEGKKSVNDLYKSTYSQTKQTSFEEYGDLRKQEPTVEGNIGLSL